MNQSNEPKHTPTPDDGIVMSIDAPWTWTGQTHGKHAIHSQVSGRLIGWIESKEDAHRIVRAVNSHEVLLAILEDIKMECSAAFDDVSNQTSEGRKARTIFEKVGKWASKAIAKADGK